MQYIKDFSFLFQVGFKKDMLRENEFILYDSAWLLYFERSFKVLPTSWSR